MLLDVNVLLYAYGARGADQERAKAWLENALNGYEPVLLPWATILGFLRIATNLRAFERPLSLDEAIDAVSGWLARPNVRIAQPTERHWELLAASLREAQAKGPLVPDAHLAVLALEHGATVCTTDRDFARFKNVRTTDPLRD